MRGDIVLVRGYGNHPHVRRVWSWDAHAVYVASDFRYARLEGGDESAMPVGIWWGDVFQYVGNEEVDSLHTDVAAWGSLTKWTPRQ